MKFTYIAMAALLQFGVANCANAQIGPASPTTGNPQTIPSSSMPLNTGMSQPKSAGASSAAPATQASYVTSPMPSNTGMSRHKPKKHGSGWILHRKETSAPSGNTPDFQSP